MGGLFASGRVVASEGTPRGFCVPSGRSSWFGLFYIRVAVVLLAPLASCVVRWCGRRWLWWRVGRLRLLLALRLFGRVAGYRPWRGGCVSSCVLLGRLVCRLVPGRWAFASRLLVSCGRLVRDVSCCSPPWRCGFAEARRCLLVMPSRRSVVRIVICLICGVSSSSSLCRADA